MYSGLIKMSSNITKTYSKITNLLNKNIFLVSRQKTLLKKRKTTSKKQKVAKKKFLQQNPNQSYTHQLKILQIQKQLDKKVIKNHHLNQLMDQLFYPDVRYANQKVLQQNLLKISLNPSQNMTKKAKNGQETQINDQQEQSDKFDQLGQQIYMCQIPSQLFEVYLKNSQFFSNEHLLSFMIRLKSYFKNKQKIEQRVIRKWKQASDKLKLTDQQKKKRRRCPYVFLQQQQLIRDESWNKIIKSLNQKIKLSTQAIAEQSGVQSENNIQEQKQSADIQQSQNSQQLAQQHQESIDPSYYFLQNNCQLILSIYSAAAYIPEQLFDSVIQKALTILKLENNSKKQKNTEKLAIFSHKEKVKLLRVISLKSKTKSTLTKSLQIQTPQQSLQQQQTIISFSKKLCQDILNSQECDAEDLGAILRSGKGYYKFVNAFILDLSKPKILKFMNSTNLQRSVDYLYAFWLNGTTKDHQFIQVLLFDIYRKLPYSFSKSHLFFLLSFIKNNQITFRQSQMIISISEIYPRIAETLTKFLNRGQLTHQQIKIFLNSVYQSYPMHRPQGRINVIQMISTTILKIGEGYKLQQLGQLLLKITLLGHRSKIFSKYVFERYLRQYRKLKRQYKESRTPLITDFRNQKNKLQNQALTEELPSIDQILLEQSLIMMMWSFVISHKFHQSDMPLSDMLQVYPLNSQSQDPMIQSLIKDLNTQLSEFNLFPSIKISTQIKKNDRRKSFQTLPLFKTNTFKKYQYIYNSSIAEQLLLSLQSEHKSMKKQNYLNLIHYVMRYCLVETKQLNVSFKLPNRWSDSVKDLTISSSQTYKKMETLFFNLQNKQFNQQNKSIPQTQNPVVIQIFKRLIRLIQNTNQHSLNKKQKMQFQPNNSLQTKHKKYQLL